MAAAAGRGGQNAEPDSGRTCYDHLDVDTLRGGIRPLIRYCVDWSEQVEHMCIQGLTGCCREISSVSRQQAGPGPHATAEC